MQDGKTTKEAAANTRVAVKLIVSLVTSILLYGCETWTLLADSEERIQAFRNQVPEETSPHLLLRAQDQRLPCGSTGTSSDNCQETQICMLWTVHTPRQLLQNYPPGHLGRWATP